MDEEHCKYCNEDVPITGLVGTDSNLCPRCGNPIFELAGGGTMKLMIEVSGGVVTNITATGEVSIYLIDHDNLKAGQAERADYVEEHARRAFQPDLICDETTFMENLEETLSEYEEGKG